MKVDRNRDEFIKAEAYLGSVVHVFKSLREQAELGYRTACSAISDSVAVNTFDGYQEFERFAAKVDMILDSMIGVCRRDVAWKKEHGFDSSGILGCIYNLEAEKAQLWDTRLDAYNCAKMMDGPDLTPPSEAELEQAEAERKQAYATGGASLVQHQVRQVE